jgi:hypothetical protein
MIAVVITAFLLTGLYNVFGNQERAQILVDQVAEMNQDLRVAANWIVRDMRMAGFHVENQTATCGTLADGTGSGPLSAVVITPGASTTDPDSITLVYADANFSTTLQGAVAAAGANITVAEGCPGPGLTDDCSRCFCAGNAILVTDGANTSVFQVTASATSFGSAATIKTGTTGPYNTVAGHGAFPGYGDGMRVFKAVVRRYMVDKTDPNRPVLRKADGPAALADLVDYIEDLQVEDPDNPGAVPGPNLQAYNVTITARTRKPLTDVGGIRRKTFTETVRLRNIPL